MGLGSHIRLKRIFGHPSGRLCSVAIDHFLGYAEGIPAGLRQVKKTLEAVMKGRPDAVTMHKGLAPALWPSYAGSVPFILQSSAIRPDDSAMQQIAMPEEAVRLGADAFAIAAFVRGPTEAVYLRAVADAVREAARYEMPVICHIYPRSFEGKVKISFLPEDIAWAVRCALEVGADIIKTPFCGDVKAHAQIVADCPVPVVAAGGPKCGTFEEALGVMADAVQSGAKGATIGRNIWGFEHVTAALEAFKAVIHDRATPKEALRKAGLAK